jgi:hypothetical protein
MNKNVILILVLLLIPFSVATKSSYPETLYVNSVEFTSNDFYFVEFNNMQISIVEYLDDDLIFSFPRYRYFNTSKKFSTISVELNNELIMKKNLSILYQNNGLYKFSIDTIFFRNTDLGTSKLSKYNNTNLRIYLDDQIVRIYKMNYLPAQINTNIINSINEFNFKKFLVDVFALIISFTLFYQIVKYLRNKKKKKLQKIKV